MVTRYISQKEIERWKKENALKRDYLENNKLEVIKEVLEGVVSACKYEAFWYPSKSIIESISPIFYQTKYVGDYITLDELDLHKILTPFINQKLINAYRKWYNSKSRWESDLFLEQNYINLYHVTSKNKDTLKKFSGILKDLIKADKNSLLNLSA